MTFLPGTVRGLQMCASEGGSFTILALDHRQNLRRELDPADPDSVTVDAMIEFKRSVVRTLSPHATATLLDPEIGAAQCILDRTLAGHVGLVVAVESTGYVGPATERTSQVLDGWSVDKIKRLGASAAKLLVYYHPSAKNAKTQERLVSEVHAACRAVDLPLFLEPITYSNMTGGRLIGDERRQVVIETAQRLSACGGDVLKVEFPYDATETDPARWAKACRAIDTSSTIPWVLLSGGVDDDLFAAQVEAACVAGASGVVVGRSVWAAAARLPTYEREGFLISEGTARLQRLASIVAQYARPWFDRPNELLRQRTPGPDWFRAY